MQLEIVLVVIHICSHTKLRQPQDDLEMEKTPKTTQIRYSLHKNSAMHGKCNLGMESMESIGVEPVVL